MFIHKLTRSTIWLRVSLKLTTKVLEALMTGRTELSYDFIKSRCNLCSSGTLPMEDLAASAETQFTRKCIYWIQSHWHSMTYLAFTNKSNFLPSHLLPLSPSYALFPFKTLINNRTTQRKHNYLKIGRQNVYSACQKLCMS